MERRLCSIIFIFISILSYSTLTYAQDSCQPTQIHLSIGDTYYTVSQNVSNQLSSTQTHDNQAYLVWHAQEVCSFTVIVTEVNNPKNIFTFSPEYFNEFDHDFAADPVPPKTSSGTYHTVVYTTLLKNLNYDVSYNYIINNVDGTLLQGPFVFRMTTPFVQKKNKKFIVIGDIDASAIGMTTINRITSLVKNNVNEYAGILNLGDISYDLQDENGKRGDKFFESFQEVLTQIPFAMALGNHDSYGQWSFVNLRIRNPLYIETQNHYYSFNWEGIHFTEINFEYFDKVTPEMQEEIFAWIENDLKAANTPENRAKFPWIVFITHRPIYCSYIEQGAIPYHKWCFSFYGVRKIWDELLHKYSVDLVLEADKHSYERMGPIYQNKTAHFISVDEDPTHHNIINPNATVYLMNGASGQNYYTPSPYQPSGFAYVADVRPSYGLLYAKKDGEDHHLVYEHYVSSTNEKIDYMNIIRTNSPPTNPKDQGSGWTIFIAVVVIFAVIYFGYIYSRRADQEVRRSGYFRASERDIPLVQLKD